MELEFTDENLSVCETIIMKAIWNEEEDISIPDLIKVLRERYGKDYARTTVTTFLTKLMAKGYVRTYRKERLSYAHAIKSEEEYKEKLLKEMVEFWYGGSKKALIEKLDNI